MEKNLKISEELHRKIKIICANNGLKINEWVNEKLEKIIKEYEFQVDKRKSS